MYSNRRRFARIKIEVPAWIEHQGERWPVTVVDLSFKGALVRAADSCPLSAGMQCAMQVGSNGVDPQLAKVRMVCEVKHNDGTLLRLACLDLDQQSVGQLRDLFGRNLGDPAIA